MQATWKPHEKHGELTAKSDLPDTVFAFPKQRKEPMTDAKHVRNAVARFDQVRTFPMTIAPWPSPTSRRRPITMTSSLPRRHGAILALIRKPIARKPPPKPSRPNAHAEQSKRPAPKPRQRASADATNAAASKARRAPPLRPHFSLQPVSEGDRQRLHPALQRLFRQRLIGRAWPIGRGRQNVYGPAAQSRDASHPVGIARSAIAKIERVDTNVNAARGSRPENPGKRAREGLLNPARGRIADISHQRCGIDADGAARARGSYG